MNGFDITVAFTVLIVCGSAVGSGSLTPMLSDISQDCSVIGERWKASPGIMVDDLTNLDAFSPKIKAAVKGIKQIVEPFGVRALADYSCVNTDDQLNMVTVRVFVFENSNRAISWWEKKYKYSGWAEHYTKVSGLRYPGIDSKQLRKRAILYQNLLITAHHLRRGPEHLTLLQHVLEKLVRI